MDEDCRFFTLGDTDFFDVPWAHVEASEEFSPPLGAGWHSTASGLWRYLIPQGYEMPEAGWKIHVSAVPAEVESTISLVARTCRAERAAWKLIRSRRLAFATQGKYAPAGLVGKLCVVYPTDGEHLGRILSALATALEGRRGPRIAGDRQHSGAPIGIRWGAFTQVWVEGDSGQMIPGVRRGEEVVPDRRGRRDEESEPPLPEHLAELFTEATGPSLPIRQARLIRRHSAGAIYQALLEDGRPVALKEARHHAGVDRDGTDAVARLRHEYAVLRHLSGHSIAPEPEAYWELDHSDILVMGWIDGDSMTHRISHEHPRSCAGITAERTDRYWAWSAGIRDDLEHALEALHERGVAHGDLQPGNVVLGNDGLRFVDLECATLNGTAATSAMVTPGFHVDHPDPIARDRFAAERTIRCAVDPDVTLLDRRPELAAHFGVDSGDLQVGAMAPTDLPARLAVDMRARATTERPDRLFPGGVEQFRSPLGGHDLLAGAAGVLLALDAAGYSPNPEHLDWLVATLPLGAARQIRGFGTGIDGIAFALARLGRQEQAAELIDASTTELPRDPSWARGRSGCAVALLELGRMLARPDLTAAGRAAAEAVSACVDDPGVHLGGVGLYEGWSGVSLALTRAAQLHAAEAPRWHRAAVTALKRERAALTPEGGTLTTRSAGRVNTTLGNGTAAFVLASSRLHEPSAEVTRDAALAARGCAEVRAPVAGLRDGLAGSALALAATGDHGSAVAQLSERASWHAVPTAEGWSVLGEQRLRCSDDVATGTAGVLIGTAINSAAYATHVLALPHALSARPGEMTGVI